MNDNSLSEGSRITLKRKRPNPLFQEWLEELHEEAQAKKSKLEPMLNEALASISKYPLPLQTGAECAVLQGFDRRLCIFLDKRLQVYKYNQQETDTISTNISEDAQFLEPQSKKSDSTISATSSASTLKSDSIVSGSSNSTTSLANSNANKYGQNTEISIRQTTSASSLRSNKDLVNTCKSYRPRFRSGGYAILIALLENLNESNNTFMYKEQLIDKAQKYSEESFIRPKPDTFYTVWSNMKLLKEKGLVNSTTHKKTKYSLTEKGVSVATELLEESKHRPTVNDIIFKNALPSESNSINSPDLNKASTLAVNGNAKTNSENTVILPAKTKSSTICHKLAITEPQRSVSEVIFVEMLPDTFDVVLLIDKNETSGASNKNDPTVAQFNKYPDLKHEYRSLKVGDFTWIARNRNIPDQELVLPYVVERKRMDDLGASIKDGRFHEQKFRLKKCGLKNVIYLLENYGSNKYVGLPLQSLLQALANTRVHDNFKVHVTNSLSNTSRFLAMMTKRLTIEYKDRQLSGSNSESTSGLMTFDFFNKSSAKNKPLTVTDTFIKLLLQLKGVSIEKALAITKYYSTPRLLIKKYEGCSKQEGQFLLADLKYGEFHPKVGPSLSKTIYEFINKVS